jgi:hypothetical protein
MTAHQPSVVVTPTTVITTIHRRVTTMTTTTTTAPPVVIPAHDVDTDTVLIRAMHLALTSGVGSLAFDIGRTLGARGWAIDDISARLNAIDLDARLDDMYGPADPLADDLA